jgi:enterochelin esterase-like enzyme
MNLDLLSQNLLLILCAVFTAIGMYLVLRLLVTDQKTSKKPTKKEKHATKSSATKRNLAVFVLALAWSAVAAFLIKFLFAYLTDSQLPDSVVLMSLPFTGSIALLLIVLRTKSKLWIMAASCVLLGLAFSLLLANSYYRFYPTLGGLFDKDSNVQNSGRYRNNVFVNITHTISSSDNQTIQGELDSITGQPTHGQVYSLNIPGTVSKFKARTAYVYVPVSYNELSAINFPVIILTAGFPGMTENWLNSGLEATMDQFAQSHEGITPLVFIVDNTGSLTNDTECVDSPRGNVETYLTTDVPNYIKSHFRVDDSPANWAIGGLSMGGMCGVMLTLRHPSVFHYFMDYGGEVGPEVGSQQKTTDELFDGSESAWAAHQPAILLTTKNFEGLGLGGFFGDGDQDARIVTTAISELTADSQNAGVETVSETISGPHSFQVWQQLFKNSLPWISNRIGATQCGVNGCI